ncbi:MAG: hypothetical protein AB7E79_00285 [Rhodospirillaceae bacterium]
MRTIVAVVAAASLLASSAFAMDPFNGQGWQKSRPPAAVAYLKFQFHAGKKDERASYGLAVTAPTPRVYASSPILLSDTPKLLDLRFKDGLPHRLLLSEQTAWSMTPDQEPSGSRHNLFFDGPVGWVFSLALTGAAIYGIYTLVKKECPAISTSTGGCVEPAN